MSAPDTNVKKQERRHKPALVGMAVAAVVVIAAIIAVNAFGADEELDEAASGAVIESE
jgi:hypothetical protein